MRSTKRNGLLAQTIFLSLHVLSCSDGASVAVPEPLPGGFASGIETGDSNPNTNDPGQDYEGTGTSNGKANSPGSGNATGSNGSGGLQAAQDIEDGTYYIANGDNSNCLEIVGALDAPADILQAKCDLSERQFFKVTHTSDGQFTITNLSGTMALEFSDSSSGANLVQNPLSGGISQRFEITKFLDIIIPTYTIRSSSSRLYLQVDTDLNGSPIVQNTFSGQSSQVWTLLPAN